MYWEIFASFSKIQTKRTNSSVWEEREYYCPKPGDQQSDDLKDLKFLSFMKSNMSSLKIL